MKENFNTEKLVVIILGIIIFGVIVFVVFNVFTDNRNLYNNNPVENLNSNNNSTNTQSNSNNSNSNENSKNNISNEGNNDNNNDNNSMNIDPENVNEINNNKTQEEIISTYTSSIYDKDQNRVDNITLANSKLNGVIVKKGEEFSFNNTIGPMNEAQGFKKAIGFDSNGKKIKISGGGLCQISSTLYNAVLEANLEVTERHAHSRRVYYVPKDRDATILYGSLDFKFRNTSDSDIKIESTNDSTNVVITLKKI